MGSQSPSVLDGERDQDVRAPMNGRNRLPRRLVCQELLVLRLLCGVSGDGCHLMQHDVSVDRGHHKINNKVATIREEVQRDDISRSRAVCRTEPPGFLDNGRIRHASLVQDEFDGADEACVQKVAHASVGALNDVAFHGLLCTRMYPALRAMKQRRKICI